VNSVPKMVETVTNVAILAVCGLLCWTLLTHKNFFSGAAPINAETTQLEGKMLPTLHGYHWGDHPGTLVLAIRRGCHFCEASLPFYKRLGDLEKKNALRAHVLAVMPDDQGSGAGALQSGGVAVEGIFNQPLDTINVSGTPTLLLLDTHGRVARAWVGQLTPQSENDVIVAAEK